MNKIKLYVTCEPAKNWEKGNHVIDGFAYGFWLHNPIGIEGYIMAGSIEIDYEPPEGFDPRAGAVAALEAEKTRIQAEFQKRITDIEAQINKYTALEFAA